MLADYKMSLAPLSLSDAPPASRRMLEVAKAQVGFIPNMYANMAHSPGLLETYLLGYGRFREESGFSPQEQEVVFLTISRDNGCEYCVSAHSMLADTQSGLAPAVTNALRSGNPLPDPALQALSRFTSAMVASRGLPTKQEVGEFLAAGYAERQILEVILAIAVKTLSNYANHIFHTPLDPVFEARRWADSR